MNAIEIEQAITDLAEQPFDFIEFPYQFLEAFGNKSTTIKRLRAGTSNKSDLGGVLQTNNIHLLTCETGKVTQALAALKASPVTAKAKAKFVLATDGFYLEAEDLTSGETVACAFKDFPDHFGFFLPLAGISTVRQISENAFDIRATSRLNRLYVELLKENPIWGTAERSHDMNKFMARLIFCFFAEDTDIFVGKGRFTETIEQMSLRDSSNTHEVIAILFRTMNTNRKERAAAGIPRWADEFPYVNGRLFSGNDDVPRFSKIARSYLLHVGSLDWTKINPDIFGSMIQAIAEDEERGELGMHYTSVPNILKVLNPLFLDDLRTKLEEADDNARALLNLRKRIARIRIFDPACGSGNFLVIAYKEMRAIEAEINRRRDEPDRKSEIPITNFRGIELRDFPAEIARLALVIAEYQCDVLYRGQRLALAEFLPLRYDNWITCDNALRLDWLSLMDVGGSGVKLVSDNLLQSPLNQAEIDFENEGGETYICGNPPYVGSSKQSAAQKSDIQKLFEASNIKYKNLDYISGWFWLASKFCKDVNGAAAFVTTNSICQGEQVNLLWPTLLNKNMEIYFAHTSFKWSNLAKNKAGVTCVIVGIRAIKPGSKFIYFDNIRKEVTRINPYLLEFADVFIPRHSESISSLPKMLKGNQPTDGGNLILAPWEKRDLLRRNPEAEIYLRKLYGSKELIDGVDRYCIWIEDYELKDARSITEISRRLGGVTQARLQSPAQSTRKRANDAHRFIQIQDYGKRAMVVPEVSSEKREYIPCGILDEESIATNKLFAVYEPDLYVFALCSSKLHRVWVEAVCGKLEERISYSNVLGYNTFPVPELTEKNKADLTRCAEDILLAREHHFPATIADLYDQEKMPPDLRMAHERNDEVLERIYIGRRFKNNTERLEKLFDLYTKMTSSTASAKSKKRMMGAN
ncbi:TPA: class I SAM-dependent DNA methyltransferase [Enterobacter roggenkampii]|uniref:site-specific DNA-methyltransferase (adenine-specific) n=1 Tax=Enterobacter lignolyticus (strain SCF1) TaxID=701347 RepID=E3G730_ENTLS|nr:MULTISPECIES: DNA methyltransferase [Enterobacteriaceae]ADO47354.1 putative DNA methylase [[Enterobacter] lignolyticus SCF1]HAS0883344.1 class I SAM-dependent DNA methyltransferase [Enterobacter roggenkampii]HDT3695473.1 class I SAM-dependent DNA methyltransferase [Enterobacter roggenkampii]